MVKPIFINKKINVFNKNINISGDKSLSIRWALLASQAIGKSKAYNLLESDDVKSTIKAMIDVKRSAIKILKHRAKGNSNTRIKIIFSKKINLLKSFTMFFIILYFILPFC